MFWVAVALFVLALVVVFSTIKIVPQGREFTVERFGKYTRTLSPGIHLLTPFVEGIGRRMNMMEQVLDVPTQEVITKDNAMVKVDGIVFIQVMDAARAAYRVDNLSYAIAQLCMTNLRTVVGSMELDEVLSQRDAINSRLLTVIDSATEPWGVKANRIEIKDLTPPADITNAMARQMKAERERRAVITEADGEKQAAIARAEGAKQAAILEAEGRKEAAFRDAEAREREAEAEAKATAMVSEAIARGDVNAINYFVAQRYVEAFAELARSPQQKTVIVPAEMGGLVGTIAGLGELVGLAKEQQQTRTDTRRDTAAARRRSPHGVELDGRDGRPLRVPALLDLAGARRFDPGGGSRHGHRVAAVAGGLGGGRGPDRPDRAGSRPARRTGAVRGADAGHQHRLPQADPAGEPGRARHQRSGEPAAGPARPGGPALRGWPGPGFRVRLRMAGGHRR